MHTMFTSRLNKFQSDIFLSDTAQVPDPRNKLTLKKNWISYLRIFSSSIITDETREAPRLNRSLQQHLYTRIKPTSHRYMQRCGGLTQDRCTQRNRRDKNKRLILSVLSPSLQLMFFSSHDNWDRERIGSGRLGHRRRQWEEGRDRPREKLTGVGMLNITR